MVARWANVPAAAEADVAEAPGRGDGRVTTREVRLGEERCRWDLTLTRGDDKDPTVEWRAEVTAVFDLDRTTLVVRLRRNSMDHRLRPLAGSPVPPRVIRNVLEARGVDCFDGPIRVEPRWQELRANGVSGFVETQLLAEDRRLPILGVAKVPQAAQDRLDVRKLTQVLAGFAHVVLLDRAALPRLGDELGNLSVAPSSARLWWPGMQLDDGSAVHPYWEAPFERPAAVVEAIRRLVLTVSRDRWREPARVVEFGRDLRNQREQVGRAAATRLTEEIASLRASAAADRARAEAAAAEAASSTAQVDIEAYEQQLERVAGDLSEVQDELERQRVAAEDAESAWVEAEEQRTRLEQENRALVGQVEGLKAQLRNRGSTDPQELTPEQLFEAEVRASWQQRLTDDDRTTHPLAAFILREEFIESIDRAAADRQKVVDTVMEVACGRAKEIDGRQLHKLRAGTGGNSPERRRESDGAVAWRCNIQTNSPSARRLHFWLCPGGSIEFVSVVTHDDFSVTE
jgi:hypothetical protein